MHHCAGFTEHGLDFLISSRSLLGKHRPKGNEIARRQCSLPISLACRFARLAIGCLYHCIECGIAMFTAEVPQALAGKLPEFDGGGAYTDTAHMPPIQIMLLESGIGTELDFSTARTFQECRT